MSAPVHSSRAEESNVIIDGAGVATLYLLVLYWTLDSNQSWVVQVQ